MIECNGCTACCHKDVVVLTNAEARRLRSHVERHNGRKFRVLDRREDGGCVYLNESGCSIHDEAPGICKRMDCRDLIKTSTPEFRRIRVVQNPQMEKIYSAAEARL